LYAVRSKLIRHRGESRIGLFFEKNADLIAHVKKVEGSKWSQSLKVWHIPDTVANRTRFKVIVNEPSAEGYLQLEQFQRYFYF
jgi:integrase/recombinase XerD